MNNQFGIHLGNRPGGNRGIEELLALGFHNYTSLHFNTGEMLRVREKYPNALILIRFYQSEWSDHDPIEWAEWCAKYYFEHDLGAITDHFTPANEMNLPNEGGGWRMIDYQRINAWLLAWAQRFRELVPGVILHFPALAFGHAEDTGGYERLCEALEEYDVIDYHPYWHTQEQLFDPRLSRWYAFRFVSDHEKFFPDKPVFISECGNWDVGRRTTSSEFIFFFESLSQWPWVLGATAFIWDSGGEHRANRWMDSQFLRETMRQVYKPIIAKTPVSPKYTPRLTAWYNTLAEDAYGTRDIETVDTVVVHHLASHNPPPETEDGMGELIDAVRREHRSWGWPGIAYHYLIDSLGGVWWAGGGGTIRWHAGNWKVNVRSIGVAFPGNFEGTNLELTTAQIEAFLWLRNRWKTISGNDMQVVTHKEVRLGPTECPGDGIEKVMEILKHG